MIASCSAPSAPPSERNSPGDVGARVVVLDVVRADDREISHGRRSVPRLRDWPAMSAGDWLLLVVAGVAGGLAGSIAGLASLTTYPALLAIGLGPVAANVTNTVALVFSSAGSVSGSRPELTGQGARVRRLGVVRAARRRDGLRPAAGHREATFERLAPWLIGFASLAILVRPRPRPLQRPGHRDGPRDARRRLPRRDLRRLLRRRRGRDPARPAAARHDRAARDQQRAQERPARPRQRGRRARLRAARAGRVARDRPAGRGPVRGSRGSARSSSATRPPTPCGS